jgi:Fur family transcriptional regulator, ferric uptake regulator
MNKKVGQRRTEQRQIIFNIIKSAPGPLSAYDIFNRAQEGNQKSAISTIYRTVKLLLKHEEIKVVNLPDGQQRYAIPSLQHHHHFQCKTCDIVLEIDHCCMPPHDGEIQGHLAESHEITIYGTCKDCR